VVRLETNPYLPASLKVSAGKPRPTAAISARLATLVYRVVNFMPLVQWLDSCHSRVLH
jgi:hypothetical protein